MAEPDQADSACDVIGVNEIAGLRSVAVHVDRQAAPDQFEEYVNRTLTASAMVLAERIPDPQDRDRQSAQTALDAEVVLAREFHSAIRALRFRWSRLDERRNGRVAVDGSPARKKEKCSRASIGARVHQSDRPDDIVLDVGFDDLLRLPGIRTRRHMDDDGTGNDLAPIRVDLAKILLNETNACSWPRRRLPIDDHNLAVRVPEDMREIRPEESRSPDEHPSRRRVHHGAYSTRTPAGWQHALTPRAIHGTLPLGMSMLSILVPVYFNEHNLPVTIPVLKNIIDRLPSGMTGEIVCVDDGSGDRSYEILRAAAAEDTRIKIVRLSKNFGAYMALLAALEAASGDAMAVIMADLQDPPELILHMVDAWRDGKKIVIAERIEREDRWSDRLFAAAFWGFMRRFAIRNLPKGGFDFILFDRVVADAIRRAREKNSHFMLQVFTTGFEYATIPYARKRRAAGKSRWTFSKKFKLFIDSAISFSYVPVRAMSLIGVLTAIAGFAAAIVYVAQRLTNGIPIQGWTTTIVAILIIGGIQMIMLGIIGEYVWRAYDETRKRAPYVVAERINLDAQRGEDARTRMSAPTESSYTAS